MVKPDKQCDLVLKGGITSGVVYPRAIVELSKHYCFENIGGTSAGAIAAAVTAAAEYGRETGGFDRINDLPDELAASLLEKFQPQPQLRALYGVLIASLTGRIWTILGALVAGYGRAALIWAVPGLLVLVLPAFLAVSWAFAWLGLLLAALGFSLGICAATLRQVMQTLPSADYGICSGLTEAGFGGPALTDWLAETIDRAAGRDVDGPPLGLEDLSGRGITVRTVTTDVTTHRPYALPMANNLHLFSESEFRRLFPKRVVDQMIAGTKPFVQPAPQADLHYFNVKNMPLVVIARMSLSFPGLISAVPLWRKDYTLVGAEESNKLVRCLFSDGGLSSNFPVHFFDTFLPQAPTFGISLGQFDPRRAKKPDEEKARVVLPLEASQGQLLPTLGFAGLPGFLMALFDSAKDWQDSLQSILPGYRERIVTANLKNSEGGLNFDMTPERIYALTELGAKAGREIVRDFNLNEHRWRRYLVEIRAIDEMLQKFAEGYDGQPQPGALRYPDLAVSYAPLSYSGLSRDERVAIKDKADRIAALGRTLKDLPPLDAMKDRLPKSRSRLRSIARMED